MSDTIDIEIEGSLRSLTLNEALTLYKALEQALGFRSRSVPWTRDELVDALRTHGAEIRVADEWRPLARHVLALIELAMRGGS